MEVMVVLGWKASEPVPLGLLVDCALESVVVKVENTVETRPSIEVVVAMGILFTC